MLNKEYVISKIDNSITDQERTQNEQNLLLLLILEKLTEQEVKKSDKIRTTSKSVKTT